MPELESSHSRPATLGRRMFQPCCWPTEGQSDILFHEELRLLAA